MVSYLNTTNTNPNKTLNPLYRFDVYKCYNILFCIKKNLVYFFKKHALNACFRTKCDFKLYRIKVNMTVRYTTVHCDVCHRLCTRTQRPQPAWRR